MFRLPFLAAMRWLMSKAKSSSMFAAIQVPEKTGPGMSAIILAARAVGVDDRLQGWIIPFRGSRARSRSIMDRGVRP